jgi:hypothetical protein
MGAHMSSNLLNELDIRSQTWEKIRTHYEKRLETLRKQLENPAKTERETDFLRGQVKECRNMLALGNPDPAKVTDAA